MDSIAIKQLPYAIEQSESAKAIPAARAFWSGQLRISLVTIGINWNQPDSRCDGKQGLRLIHSNSRGAEKRRKSA
jgi:hypothetical protein